MRISDWSSDVCSSDLIDAFARLGTASDRFNMFDRFAGGGLKFGGWVPGRPEDEFGIAFAAAFPSDSWRRATAAGPAEIAVAASYRAQIAPWLPVQPRAHSIRNTAQIRRESVRERVCQYR